MSSSDRPGPSNPHDDSYDSDCEILNARIEQTLDRWFAPPLVNASDLADLQRRFDEQRLVQGGKQRNLSVANRGHSSRRAILILAVSLAASVIVGFVGIRLLNKPEQILVFNRQPLAAVYWDLVARGFHPYYLCDDQKRFQETMQHRHAQPLALSDRGNSLMLGISYPGGWTSETTAILFRLDGKPVVVFVDSQPFPNDELAADGTLNIRVKELPGIFMVEVSPASESLLDTISELTAKP